MVCVNSNPTSITFKHFVSVPSSACVIATAIDERKKLKLYLIINGDDAIYKRNGLNDTWDKLESEQKSTIRELVRDALADSSIPQYSTDSLSVLN